MHEIPLALKLIGTHKGVQLSQTHQGWLRNGVFYYTDLSGGRAAQEQTLSDFHLVTTVTERLNGQPLDETRTIGLGPGVIYRFQDIRVQNVDGKIDITTIGFDDKPEHRTVNPGEIIGGSIPNTIFLAQEEAGFSLAQ